MGKVRVAVERVAEGASLARVDGAARHSAHHARRRPGGDSVHYILKKRQEEAGLEGITPHDFRRGMITRLLAAGVDVFTVQQLAGHADAVTTARYDRRGEEGRRAAVGHLRLPVTA